MDGFFARLWYAGKAEWKDMDVYTLDDVQEMNFALDLREEIERREHEKARAKSKMK